MGDPRRAPRVLFQLSGSIAAYKSAHVMSRLVQAGCEVQTAATESALQFLGPATLEGLTGRPVAVGTFASGSQMDHIHLVRWADLILLCPATANTINRLATGIAADLIGTMFLAHDFTKPFVLVPAMNTAMYQHPATAASLDRLRGWGVEVLEPDAGALACGEIGPGRLSDPDVIIADVLRRFDRFPLGTEQAANRHRILVTAGGTKARIDGVRSITNSSTGRTGATIAAHLAGSGHRVTLLHASDAVVPDDTAGVIERESFDTFADLERLLRTTLAVDRYDAVVHLAAVGDYDVDHVVVDGKPASVDPGSKIDSGDAIEIHLRKNPKLLAQLTSMGGEHLVIVGFKLTNGATPDERRAAVAKVMEHSDLVVHNDLTAITDDRHPATIYRGEQVLAEVDENTELAAVLEREIVALLAAR